MSLCLQIEKNVLEYFPYIGEGCKKEVWMKNFIFNDIEYSLEKNYKDAFDYEEVKELCTDYFEGFDYIFGDYSYSKLRLKGFYDSNNKKVKDINNIKGLDDYIKDYCSFECRYFLLRKQKDK